MTEMETGVWVALIASLTSLIVAAISLHSQRKGAKEEREEKQRSDARVILDKYREPLLAAASDLGFRIDHIRNDKFLMYAAPKSERYQQAKLTTMFRFAQYFGWREILRTEVQLLRFEHETDTELAAKLISHIDWAFASDILLDGPRGMLWAEEQRGIGELMVAESERSSPTHLGYAHFVREYDKKFALWMERMADFVLGEKATSSDRLRLLQWALFGLVNELDEERAHTDEIWMNRTWEELKKYPVPEPPNDESEIRSHVFEAVRDHK
jgi:hypothetical protein